MVGGVHTVSAAAFRLAGDGPNRLTGRGPKGIGAGRRPGRRRRPAGCRRPAGRPAGRRPSCRPGRRPRHPTGRRPPSGREARRGSPWGRTASLALLGLAAIVRAVTPAFVRPGGRLGRPRTCQGRPRPQAGSVWHHAVPLGSSPWCPASMAASRARSAGERVASAAASFTSGSPWSAADGPRAVPPWSIPSPSLPWSASRLEVCGGGVGEVASGVPSFAFSAWLVQTLVQTGGGVGVSALLLSLASWVPLLDKLGVGGSSPLSPTNVRCLSRKVCVDVVFAIWMQVDRISGQNPALAATRGGRRDPPWSSASKEEGPRRRNQEATKRQFLSQEQALRLAVGKDRTAGAAEERQGDGPLRQIPQGCLDQSAGDYRQPALGIGRRCPTLLGPGFNLQLTAQERIEHHQWIALRVPAF